MESLIALLNIVTAMSPVGVIALLGVIILLLVSKHGPIRKISDNHLHDVTNILERVADNGDKQLDALNEIKADISWVKGKLD